MNMKNRNKIGTLILVVLAAISGVGTANATKTVVAHSHIYLVAGSESNFETYMSKKAKRFIKKNNEDWATFNKVVRLYNSSTGTFLSVSKDDKADFFEAVATINDKLEKMGGRDSKVWQSKVDVTEKVFAFLWSNRPVELPLENIEQIPSMQLEPALGR